jgi:hypothetical protein
MTQIDHLNTALVTVRIQMSSFWTKLGFQTSIQMADSGSDPQTKKTDKEMFGLKMFPGVGYSIWIPIVPYCKVYEWFRILNVRYSNPHCT